MTVAAMPAGRKADPGGDATRPFQHVPAVHRLIHSLVEYLDGQPFSTEDQARKLRSQASAVAKLLPPVPPADLTELATACAVAAGATRRFMNRAEGFDNDALHWPEHIANDLSGIEYALLEVADFLPPVPAALRDKRTLPDAAAEPELQLVGMLVVLEHVEDLAFDACETLPFLEPLYGKPNALGWAVRIGTGCLWGETLDTNVNAARERLERDGL